MELEVPQIIGSVAINLIVDFSNNPNLKDLKDLHKVLKLLAEEYSGLKPPAENDTMMSLLADLTFLAGSGTGTESECDDLARAIWTAMYKAGLVTVAQV